MPPVNTPAVTSPSRRSPDSAQTASQQRPLTPLSYLSSPVPDFASTLHTQVADATDEENISFLRDSLESLDRATQTSPRPGVDPSRDPRLSGTTEATTRSQGEQQNRSESAAVTAQRDRLQRYLSQLYRFHNPPAPTATAYTNRTPSPNRQSLYDWAPAYDGHVQESSDLDAIVSALRRDQAPVSESEAPRSFPRQEDSQRDNNNTGTGLDLDGAEVNISTSEQRRRRDRERHTLRNRAVLQRTRQEGSPSATERMLRYFMDRERSGLSEEEERARGTGWYRPHPTRTGNDEGRVSAIPTDHWLLSPRANEIRERDRQERVDAFRRGYLAENMPPRLPRISTPPSSTTPATNSTSFFLENALKYLNDLRRCGEYEEALVAAIDHSLANRELFAEKHDEFILDLDDVHPPLPTSYLQPGAVFEGHQHASSASLTRTQHRTAASNHVVDRISSTYRSHSTHDPLLASTRVPTHSNFQTPHSNFDANQQHQSNHSSGVPPISKLTESLHDHWPVRVIIHSIDPQKMMLQGTMEAYDVPQHPAALSILQSGDRPRAGKKNAPITTYLEGHIIDSRTHSFLTPCAPETLTRQPPDATTAAQSTSRTHDGDTINFPAASPAIDAANWRRLPPFNQLASDHDMAQLLLSKERANALNTKYVFMRWKERCFVHGKNDSCAEADRHGDHDRGHGLTISGFYYVSMRRSDGAVEGLYFDPTSTPYQHLRLSGLKATWPSWEFR